MKSILIALLLLAIGSAMRTQPSHIAPDVELSWQTKLSELPTDVRTQLIAQFDFYKEIRKRHPEFKKSEDDIITDQRQDFARTCSALPGQATILFVRAAPVEGRWIVQYEYGGVASGEALVILTPDSGEVFHVSEPIYINNRPALEASIQKLKRSLTKR